MAEDQLLSLIIKILQKTIKISVYIKKGDMNIIRHISDNASSNGDSGRLQME